jgi:hypothetical protein
MLAIIRPIAPVQAATEASLCTTIVRFNPCRLEMKLRGTLAKGGLQAARCTANLDSKASTDQLLAHRVRLVAALMNDLAKLERSNKHA